MNKNNDFIIDGTTLVGYEGADTIVIVPDGITSIGNNAFADNDCIQEVILPDSVEYIGDESFIGCTNLRKMKLPVGIKHAYETAFYGCDRLILTAPENFDLAPLFDDEVPNAELTEYTLDIQDHVVVGFDGGGDVVIPDGVVAVGVKAFGNIRKNHQIVSVFVSDTVHTLHDQAFLTCSNLESVRLPSTMQRIGTHAFYDCCKLKEIRLPSDLKTIEIGSFAKCRALSEITVPESVTEIKALAFAYCIKLEQVRIPDSVKKIAPNAFFWSRKITIHAPAGSYAEQYAKENYIPFVAE